MGPGVTNPKREYITQQSVAIATEDISLCIMKQHTGKDLYKNHEVAFTLKNNQEGFQDDEEMYLSDLYVRVSI